ncbi:MAG: T9SS type A sorting domain-containing protein [Saprospiraceae bacterium]|nr:MAG: T9SS type A sorting domain-containing protein [Saprospiraceae bacterium]
MKKILFPLLLLAGFGPAAQAGTFTEYHALLCGTIIELGPVGYPNWNPATVIKEPEHGQVFIFTNQPYPDSMFYKSDYGYLGQDTFVVVCAHATQITCDTGIYIISAVGCPPIFAFTETHDITCDSTLLVPGLGYPVWTTPKIEQPPQHGTATILSANSADLDTLMYVPAPDFSGADTVIVTCAHATQITCETGIYIFDVSCVNATGDTGRGLALSVFPNPVRGTLHIKAAVPIERLVLAAASGTVVQAIEMKSSLPEATLNLHGIAPGCYFLTVWSSTEMASRKIIVAW